MLRAPRAAKLPMLSRISPKLLFKLMNFWPPYLGAGIRVGNVDMENLSLEVELKFRFWNKNFVGTQFGGSLYAMADPFYMLLLVFALGRDYIVWDKAADIRFKKPGRGPVRAKFRIPQELVNEIRERLKTERKFEPRLLVEVRDDQGELVAEIDKTLYVRRKDNR